MELPKSNIGELQMNPKPAMSAPILYSGMIIGLVSSIPFVNIINCFCCAGVVLGGFLGVFFYKSNFTPDTPPFTSSDCLLVGLGGGILGAVISTAVSTLFTALFGNLTAKFLVEALQNSNLPNADMILDKLREAMNEPLTMLRFVSSLFLTCILYGIFGLLGGLIGYSIFKPKGLAPMPPPPPFRQA